MSLQSILTALALPPLALVILVLAAGMAGWRRHRLGAALVCACAVLLLLLSTPWAEAWLIRSLEREANGEPPSMPAPMAIIILGAETARGMSGPEVGPLTLERLRRGAALHRHTGLPLLVTGGPLSPGAPPVAALMVHSLENDFRVPVRWVEREAPDTRGNARGSAALLREAGVTAAYLVTHGWHMARAREAFARLGYPVRPAPVRISPPPGTGLATWLPRPDHLAGSWFAIREWAGRAVYALRDPDMSEEFTAGTSPSKNPP